MNSYDGLEEQSIRHSLSLVAQGTHRHHSREGRDASSRGQPAGRSEKTSARRYPGQAVPMALGEIKSCSCHTGRPGRYMWVNCVTTRGS
jgi:hypothetical protein